MTLDQLIEILKNNRKTLQEDYHVQSLRIFGSYALNQQTEDSDIDFLVDFKPGTQDIFEAKFRLKEYLQSLLNKEIDLARSEYLKPYIRKEIVAQARYAI